MTAPVGRAVLETLYAAYNVGDAGGASRLYASDGLHEEIASGQSREGRDEIGKGLERFLSAFPNAHWQPITTIAEGRHAAATYILTGTLTADLGPFAGNGQALELAGVHVIQIDAAGQITVSQDYWDAASFGRQMSR